ncbi:MAG: sensor histidine kinase KdpD [Anaerolineae bacterium]
MSEEQRPDPDALLAAIQKAEGKSTSAHLKVFFGMAAGVGKTYAMLQAAHDRKAEGADVVVGYVETHRRAETEALLAGLEVIPRQHLDYRGTTLEEMDLDAILGRKPQLVLVDELAHTNAPGTRHPKRYQDVQELLESGIDVYTTINVQHIESRTDTVQQITGITVHETVPDTLLESADEIELIDLSPDDLRKRLLEGKVYTPERVEVAAGGFFRLGNLTALREMALRLTAERVDHQLQDYMDIKRIAGPWRSTERLMVAVGPSRFSERLIRATRRMAYSLEAPWIAVYVQTSRVLSSEEQTNLQRNLALANELGAEVVTAANPNIPEELLKIARQRNITEIVMGKPIHNRWQDLLRGGSPVDHVIRESGTIDVRVITGERETEEAARPAWGVLQVERNSRYWQYLLSALIVMGVTLFNLAISPSVSHQLIGLMELFAVLVIAYAFGRGPALLAAAISALSWNFLFIEPRLTLQIGQAQDIALLLLYFAIAIVTGNLTARIRRNERTIRHNAERTLALYTMAHEMASANDLDAVLDTAITLIGRVYKAQVAILIAGAKGLEYQECSTLPLDSKDRSVAEWSYLNGRPAGRYTEALPLASATFIPLTTSHSTLGVLGIHTRTDERLSFDQSELLKAFSNQLAVVIEREILDQEMDDARVARESERLYAALLSSISHELRTPIATIVGASTSLRDLPDGAADLRHTLITDIQHASQRLNRLVENLLDMSRLESGRLQIKSEWCDIRDLVGVVVQQIEDRLGGRTLRTDVAPDLPLVQLDEGLIEQALANLLDNAVNYTPADTLITIGARATGGWLDIRIQDTGPGIAPAEIDRIFEKFYRGTGSHTGGTGLGLAIARGLAEAHGGTLTVANVPEGGARFDLRLPVGKSPPPVKEADP